MYDKTKEKDRVKFTMRRGSKHLRIAGLLEILLGAGSILAIQFLLGAGDSSVELTESAAKTALWDIILLYGFNGFKILAGLFGICLANRKSLLTVIFGVLLFFVQLVAFVQVKDDVTQIIINIVLLAIPYYYMHNAIRNYKDK